MSSHQGRGEGVSECATECHIFISWKLFYNPKIMFKHEPKVATPLLNMLSVNHER